MLTTILILVVWVAVAIVLHWYRKDYYRRNPSDWNQRMHGLIAFTDRQYWWLMTLWPLTFVLTISFIVMCRISNAIEKKKWV